jgi:quinoprotein dehydrogenase-associated probable ABC transporter substrate-binding protein
MCSRFPRGLVAYVAAIAAAAAAPAAAQPAELRVCAEPDNLPFSHHDGSGFENAIAELVARDLGRVVRYTWLPNRRGFVRKTLGEGDCDVIIGVPHDLERVRTTRPYYTSSYVFVHRERGPRIASFADPRIVRARIGIPLVADDLAATPPGHALADAGAIDNVRGFPVDGEGTQGERIVHAVATGDLDAGILWGPQAAFYAKREAVPLSIAKASAPAALAGVPFEYAIAMGVRRQDAELQRTLDDVIARRRVDIDAILARFGVPRFEAERHAGAGR